VRADLSFISVREGKGRGGFLSPLLWPGKLGGDLLARVRGRKEGGRKKKAGPDSFSAPVTEGGKES